MNQTKLPPEITERFKELPEAVQKIILESDWEETTRKIVEKYNLRVDEGAFVETEVMLIMFGFIAPENFLNDMVNEMNIDKEKATQIEYEISQNIFKLIKDKIRVVSETEDDKFISSEPNAVEEKVDGPTPSTPEPEQQDSIIEDRLNNQSVEKPKKVDPYLEPID